MSTESQDFKIEPSGESSKFHYPFHFVAMKCPELSRVLKVGLELARIARKKSRHALNTLQILGTSASLLKGENNRASPTKSASHIKLVPGLKLSLLPFSLHGSLTPRSRSQLISPPSWDWSYYYGLFYLPRQASSCHPLNVGLSATAIRADLTVDCCQCCCAACASKNRLMIITLYGSHLTAPYCTTTKKLRYGW